MAGNFRGRKLSQIGKKYDFCGENFHRLLACAVLKDPTPPKFHGENFMNSHKTAKFAKVFSLKSFPLYGTLCEKRPDAVVVMDTKFFIITLVILHTTCSKVYI